MNRATAATPSVIAQTNRIICRGVTKSANGRTAAAAAAAACLRGAHTAVVHRKNGEHAAAGVDYDVYVGLRGRPR